MAEALATATLFMFLMALTFVGLLLVAHHKLAVEVDPHQREIQAALPGANCGNCGFASCAAYAAAVASGAATVNKCTVGGPAVAAQIAALMGIELVENYPYRPVIHCGARSSDRLQKGNYIGEPTCAAADVVGGVQGCTYGCLGLGDCVASCEYDAMSMVDGLPEINYDNCVGCGACVRACPREIIEQVPFKLDQMLVVACAHHGPGKAVREVCNVGCVGCGACAKLSPELFSIDDNLASIDYKHYTGNENVAEVVEKCPMESLVVLGSPPEHAEVQLGDVEPVECAARPAPPERPTAQDLHWRG